MLPEIFKSYPSVYAVGDRYIITVIVNSNCVMWVETGGRCFYDHSNGILRSASLTHKCELPMAVLDEARSVFPQTLLANEGLTIDLNLRD